MKLYELGRQRALKELGIEKSAGLALGVGLGMLGGGALGAFAADPGQRERGAFRGALAGGALGGLGGAARSGMVQAAEGAGMQGILKADPTLMGRALKFDRAAKVMPYAAGAGALGAGYAAGDTANASPLERLYHKVRGVF